MRASIEGRGKWNSSLEIRKHGKRIIVEGRGGGWNDSVEIREKDEQRMGGGINRRKRRVGWRYGDKRA